VSTSDQFFSCDWGTTSFRLRLASISSGQVLQELKEPAGIKTINDALPKNLAADEMATARAAAFEKFLLSKIDQFAETTKPLPIVISGMASSTVGWQEVPYARTPFALDGSDMRFIKLELRYHEQELPVYLLSGLRAESDMMRGEETEILGLHSYGKFPSIFAAGTLLLPGTHSKHVQLREGVIEGFQTHMTGELFEVLSQHSLLSVSVESDNAGTPTTDPNLKDAFLAGVEQVHRHGLSRSLFQVRARSVLQGIDAAENRWFLSGLLICAEVADLATQSENYPILISASPTIGQLYQLALERVAPHAEVTLVSEDFFARAAVLGHSAWLRQQMTLESL